MALAKIQDTIEAPHIVEIEKEIGTEMILSILFQEIKKANDLINVDSRLKLNIEQQSDIAIMILDEFPHESLEDITLALRKGITGKYDEKLLRVDVQVIFRWIRLWLDEKAEFRETQMRKDFKEPESKPLTTEEEENIKKALDNSWFGEEQRRQNMTNDGFEKFKTERMKSKILSEKPKKNAKDNSQ